jgi:hypothetical protein
MIDFLLKVWAHPQVQLGVAGAVGALIVDLRKWAQADLPFNWTAFGKHALIGLLSGGGLGQIFG